ncbi:DNA replication complex GINS protein PSF2-like [Halichondria panicea]|uniref:DNA replication complex GINS protein PSF2-like n=1 Tax=Halichondria panicea TaxID=6063 RepID=UPI00312B9353
MDASEIEFLGENETVTIVPNFSEGRISLIQGDYGPFNPSMATLVPLWLAINLRKRQKCRIEPPQWLNVATLSATKTAEKDSSVFTKMPSEHYMEVASLLLNNACDDVPSADEVRAVVKDIWDLRLAKLRKSTDLMIRQQETHAKLDNLTQMEINVVRPFLTQALDHTHFLRMNATRHSAADDTQTDSIATPF